MGIYTSAKLMYGQDYSEFTAEELEIVDELLENDEISYASPWYDSDKDDWFIGVELVFVGPPEHFNAVLEASKEEVPDSLRESSKGWCIAAVPHVS